MRNVGVLDAPSARPGGHVCWCFDDHVDFREAAGAFLAEGRQLGERLVYVADGTEDELPRQLAGLGDIDGLLATGALLVEPARRLYDADAFDAVAQCRTYETLVASALEDGYTGLRVAADATALVTDEEARRRFVAYEASVDRLMAERPMTAMCAYHAPILGPAVGDLLAVHPLRHGGGDVDPGFHSFYDDGVLRVAGEIDVSNRAVFDAVTTSLEAGSDAEPKIDLRETTFIDLRSLAHLSTVAARLETSGRTLRVTGAPEVVRRCCDLLALDPLTKRFAA
ncbi:MAG TPA: MEDS domain-containing protein [Acidimicrobiales bacterium]|nr:MEDS domain-containing protein [Acidimicrobiales bacterium]